MNKSDFYYNLPEELIAQTPVYPRTSSRLLSINKDSGEISHGIFTDILKHLKKGDLLVLNDTRVLPARLFGTRLTTNSIVEFVLLKQVSECTWECLAGPGKKAKPGDEFYFSDELSAIVEDIVDDGNRIVKFNFSGNFYEILDKIGNLPLPPYIKEKLEDKERYQTVYSKKLGSAAAPTAGLHFTQKLLSSIKSMGVNIAFVTLHVGLGTFRPVKVENIKEHKMHSEHYYISDDTANMVNQTKASHGRIICVGTTSCRTLESAAAKGVIKGGGEDTNIFIYPGYKFKCMDGLITNFHLPESTLIMLVSAFAGYENTMKAYSNAVDEKYRFFSFGDAMIII